MNRYTKKTAFLLTLFISFCLPLDTIARRLFDVNYSCVKAEKIEQIFGTDATLYLYFFLFFFSPNMNTLLPISGLRYLL